MELSLPRSPVRAVLVEAWDPSLHARLASNGCVVMHCVEKQILAADPSLQLWSYTSAAVCRVSSCAFS